MNPPPDAPSPDSGASRAQPADLFAHLVGQLATEEPAAAGAPLADLTSVPSQVLDEIAAVVDHLNATVAGLRASQRSMAGAVLDMASSMSARLDRIERVLTAIAQTTGVDHLPD